MVAIRTAAEHCVRIIQRIGFDIVDELEWRRLLECSSWGPAGSTKTIAIVISILGQCYSKHTHTHLQCPLMFIYQLEHIVIFTFFDKPF